MKLNALLVDLSVLGAARLGVPRAGLRHAARPRGRRLHPGLDRRPAGPRPAPRRRRLDRQAVASRGGDGADRGRRPPPPPQPARAPTPGPWSPARSRSAPTSSRPSSPGAALDLTRREFELLQVLAEAERPGDRARGDLPAGLGLRDGPRRPLGRRLRPQAAREAPEALAGLGATSTPTSGSATGSSPSRRGDAELGRRARRGGRDRGGETVAEAQIAAARLAGRRRRRGDSCRRSHAFSHRPRLARNNLVAKRCECALESHRRQDLDVCLRPQSRQPNQKETQQVISKKWLLAAGASAVLALGVAACGDDDDSTAVERRRHAERPLRLDLDRRLEHGAAVRRGGGRALQRGEPGRQHHRRRRRHQRRLREVLRRRDRHLRRLAPDRARGGGRSARRAASSTPRSRSPTTGSPIVTNPALEISCLTTDQLAQLWTDDTVTNYCELGDDADTGEPLPDAEVSLYGPGTDSGTFDYFTDAINGEEGVSRKEYQAVRGRQRARPGRRRRRRRARATSGSPTTSRTPTRSTWSRSTPATAASRRARRRSRTASTRRSRGRCSCTRPPRRCRSPRSPAFMQYVVDNYDDDRRGRADRPDGRDAGAPTRQSALEEALG